MQKIAIIGAGKVGSTLAIVFKKAGFNMTGIISENGCSARALAAKTGLFVFYGLKELVNAADTIIIAVPDGKIAGVAENLAQCGKIDSSKTIFHTCGSQSAQTLDCLARLGGNVGSLHPLQAFSTIDLAVSKMKGTYFAVDGNKKAVEAAQKLVAAIGGNLLEIASEHRPLYHAAACMASNYMVAVVYGAVRMLQQVGIGEREALSALKPILLGTVDNVVENGTVKALTGPITRGDDSTLKRHLTQIAELSPEENALYRDIGVYAVRIAQAQGKLSREKITAMKNILQK